MKKNYLSGLIGIITAVMLAGCAGQGEAPVTSLDEKVNDHLIFHASVEAPTMDTYDVVAVKLEDPDAPDPDTVIDALYYSPKEKLTIEKSSGSAFSATLPGIDAGMINPVTKQYLYARFTEMGPYIYALSLADMSNVHRNYREDLAGYQLTDEKALALTKEAAVKIVQETAAKLKLDLEAEPYVAGAFDKDGLAAVADAENSMFSMVGAEYDWVDEDAGWYFLFRDAYQGVPIVSANVTTGNILEADLTGVVTAVFVREDGQLMWLSRNRGYSAPEKKETVKITVQGRDLADALKSFYAEEPEELHTVEQISFCYMPVRESGGILLRPGYLITEMVERADGTKDCELLKLDAVNGEIYPVN